MPARKIAARGLHLEALLLRPFFAGGVLYSDYHLISGCTWPLPSVLFARGRGMSAHVRFLLSAAVVEN